MGGGGLAAWSRMTGNVVTAVIVARRIVYPAARYILVLDQRRLDLGSSFDHRLGCGLECLLGMGRLWGVPLDHRY